MRIPLPKRDRYSLIIEFSLDTYKVGDTFVSEPMKSWLEEAGESPKVHINDDHFWLEIENPDTALLFKLTWGGDNAI